MKTTLATAMLAALLTAGQCSSPPAVESEPCPPPLGAAATMEAVEQVDATAAALEAQSEALAEAVQGLVEVTE